MNIRRTAIGHLPALAGLLLLAACQAGPGNEDPTVQIAFDYTNANRRDQEWRGQLQALDACHMQGFRDVWPKGKPVSTCRQAQGGSCTLFHESVTYDCFGMGYQPL